MLTVELKINGTTIGTVEATRRPELDDIDRARYWTHMGLDETGIGGQYTGRTRFITHNPADGAWELVRKILEDPTVRVATVEELDALPLATVTVEPDTGHVWVRHSDKWHCACDGPSVEWTSAEVWSDLGCGGRPLTVVWQLPDEDTTHSGAGA